MHSSSIGVAIVGLGIAAGAAHAHIYYFSFGMRGSSVVPASDSPATARGVLAYNHHGFLYDLDLHVSGIGLDDLLDVGPNGTPMQIYHGRRGENGPIVLDPGYFGQFEEDGDGISFSIRRVLIGGNQGGFSSNIFDNEARLYDGELYIQIFTNQYPNGEIRGQFPNFGHFLNQSGFEERADVTGPPGRIPAPAGVMTLAIAGVLGARRRR